MDNGNFNQILPPGEFLRMLSLVKTEIPGVKVFFVW